MVIPINLRPFFHIIFNALILSGRWSSRVLLYTKERRLFNLIEKTSTGKTLSLFCFAVAVYIEGVVRICLLVFLCIINNYKYIAAEL